MTAAASGSSHFERSENSYRPLENPWSVYDDFDDVSIAGAFTMKRKNNPRSSKEFSAAVGRALRRAAKVARKTARMHGTPIYIWKNGKVVAEKP
jgi:hypothetical protein